MVEITRFDRALAAVAPKFALRRVQARAAMDAVRNYDAAGTSTRSKGWARRSGGPNTVYIGQRRMIRNNVRHLVRNDPQASRCVQTWVSRLVGDGIVSRSKTGTKALDKKVDALFIKFCKNAAIDAGWTLDSLYALAVRSMVEGGDAIIRKMYVKGRDIPLALQVMEGDHLDDSKTLGLNGDQVVCGVEFNKNTDQRVAYWLYPQHPGERYGHLQSVRVPASEVSHLYLPLRAGQVAGISWLAAVTERIYDLKEYQVAAIVKAKTEACFAAFIGSDDTATTSLATARKQGSNNKVYESIEPGMVAYLPPGQKPWFANPTISPNYEQFVTSQKMDIAVGTGLTYLQVTGDPSKANYSSLKVGNAEQKILVSQLQYLLILPRLCDWVWDQFIDACIIAGLLRPRKDGYPVEHTPPLYEPVDASDDMKTDVMAVRSGIMSPQKFANRWGQNYEDVLAEWAQAKADMDAIGLPFDIDPRKAQGAAPPLPTEPTGQQKDKLDAEKT